MASASVVPSETLAFTSRMTCPRAGAEVWRSRISMLRRSGTPERNKSDSWV
jgi:hypothetical protein